MKLNLTKLTPAGVALCLLVTSCQKSNDINSQSTPAQTNSKTISSTTSMLGAVEAEIDADDARATNLTTGKDIPDCAVVTFSPSKDSYPYLKIIDYGDGCTDDQGITRKGKEFITVYADRETAPAGKTITAITYSNYYVNGVSFGGTSKTTVVKPASSGALTLKILSSRVIVDSMGNTTSYVNTTTRKRIAGNDTKTGDDDIFQANITSYGTAVAGDSTMTTFTYNTDPANLVMVPMDCDYRTQGGLQITIKETGVTTKEYLDYGNGTCDTDATLSVNGGAAQPVTLPFYFFGVQM